MKRMRDENVEIKKLGSLIRKTMKTLWWRVVKSAGNVDFCCCVVSLLDVGVAHVKSGNVRSINFSHRRHIRNQLELFCFFLLLT